MLRQLSQICLQSQKKATRLALRQRWRLTNAKRVVAATIIFAKATNSTAKLTNIYLSKPRIRAFSSDRLLSFSYNWEEHASCKYGKKLHISSRFFKFAMNSACRAFRETTPLQASTTVQEETFVSYCWHLKRYLKSTQSYSVFKRLCLSICQSTQRVILMEQRKPEKRWVLDLVHPSHTIQSLVVSYSDLRPIEL